MTKNQIPSRIAMPCPFGGFGTENITEIKKVTDTQNVNFVDGFPSAYGAPSSNNGKFVTRKEMNAIGNLASKDLFYHKCGGLNTFDPQFCAAIGGYPKGAVLQYAVANQIFEVMSLVENNKVDFTSSLSGVSGIIDGSVDGINWVYCNREIPSTGRIVLSSGDSSYITIGPGTGRVVDIVTVPARGYIVGNIELKYGQEEPSDSENWYNAISSGITQTIVGGGLFAKKISGSETAILNNQTLSTWNLLSGASQGGVIVCQYQMTTSTYNRAPVSLSSPRSESDGNVKPLTSLLRVEEGDVVAIATLASEKTGSTTVSTTSITTTVNPKLVNVGASIQAGGYSVTLSIS